MRLGTGSFVAKACRRQRRYGGMDVGCLLSSRYRGTERYGASSHIPPASSFPLHLGNLSRTRSFSSSDVSKHKQPKNKVPRRAKNKNEEGPLANLVGGPPIQFGIGKVANLTESSVIGSSGQTIALVTMASAPGIEDASSAAYGNPSGETRPIVQSVAHYLGQLCQKGGSSFSPMTVDYRQRHHAVGKIPFSANRSDNKRPTTTETLVSRAIDRALRPLLRDDSSRDSIHVSCSIQACPVRSGGAGGYPVALALNAASVALQSRLKEAVACVYLCLLEDGTIVLDPCTAPDDDAMIGELLYAGTREKVVMMEFSGKLPESRLTELVRLAHECIQPVLDAQSDAGLQLASQQQQEMDEPALRAELGLSMHDSSFVGKDHGAKESETLASKTDEDNKLRASQILDFAREVCKEKLTVASLKLFGMKDDTDIPQQHSPKSSMPRIHTDKETPLLSKSHRGRRENLFRTAVADVLNEAFQSKRDFQADFSKIIENEPSLFNMMVDLIHSELLNDALATAAIRHKSRADGRGGELGHGCTTIRPISLEVPALPDVVHGSALFTRGETQVLCTATLGPPKDGILLNDPFSIPREKKEEEEVSSPHRLPVGSLRYLKTQEYLESDLNSRKVRADREQTGESGVLRERRRAFLQYDFPSYSKGEVQSGPGRSSANRREIGHGALAEKAILPILPSASDFPYAIRMTSEVTSSNGSSSMASVCGATLALLDAGVPITAPVAGLSVGLAKGDEDDTEYQLLLDITGTEDHFGAMDFKIAGTADEVTALHLDVHEPLPHIIVFEALQLARDARGVMLQEMDSQSARSSKDIISGLKPRKELKPSTPRVEVVRFDPMRKKDLLGPGGAVIRQMEDRFNVSLDLTQEGQCLLFGDDREMVRKAKTAVMDLVADVEVGVVYEGTVIELRDFGAIIELLRNKEGLCHVSDLAQREEIRSHPEGAVGVINSLLRVGDKIEVECTAVDPVQGTIQVRPAKSN